MILCFKVNIACDSDRQQTRAFPSLWIGLAIFGELLSNLKISLPTEALVDFPHANVVQVLHQIRIYQQQHATCVVIVQDQKVFCGGGFHMLKNNEVNHPYF